MNADRDTPGSARRSMAVRISSLSVIEVFDFILPVYDHPAPWATRQSSARPAGTTAPFHFDPPNYFASVVHETEA